MLIEREFVGIKGFSKGLADSIITGLTLALLPLLVDFVDEANRADNVGGVDIIRATVIDLFSDLGLLHH